MKDECTKLQIEDLTVGEVLIKVRESGKKRRLCAVKRNAEAFRIDCISA
jgi:site-specific recombinase XerD